MDTYKSVSSLNFFVIAAAELCEKQIANLTQNYNDKVFSNESSYTARREVKREGSRGGHVPRALNEKMRQHKIMWNRGGGDVVKSKFGSR